MQRINFSFLWIIVISGLLSLFFILGNFFGLGWHRFPGDPRRYTLSGNVERGRNALEKYGCGSCHVIPGVREAHGRVGPSLKAIEEQIYLAGHLPNTPDNMLRWIMEPQKIHPGTLMPDLGVSRADAEDMVAFLYDQAQTPYERMTRGLRHMASENIP